jgi:hypothetical protein
MLNNNTRTWLRILYRGTIVSIIKKDFETRLTGEEKQKLLKHHGQVLMIEEDDNSTDNNSRYGIGRGCPTNES